MELRLEPRPDNRTDRTRACLSRPSRHYKDNSRARISLDREEPEDRHGFSPGEPSKQSRKSPYRYRHASISQRTTFFLGWLALDRGYIKSHYASLDDPFNPSQFQKCHLPSQIISNIQLKNKETNRLDDDEKRVRNGDRPFTKAKRSNCDMLDRNEPQTYASLEKMLHKTIFAIQQLKKKGNTNTSSTPKQHNLKRGNHSSLSNSSLKTNEISFDKSKAVKTTSKTHSNRCFKCHMIGHYANKCQNQKPLVTLENDKVETEPEKEELSVSLLIFDDFRNKPMDGLDEE
ncbi:hypothetical protein DY000_02030440 [Brassica cretica]|uniref:CCHC-type domain-containing protein n=1 Tax=Brassica cretica TaxID=69181 RepID=A0ABQ7DYE5_BRACR|nr:hypothetical protein DY000_02030440 [Brassica cretica]